MSERAILFDYLPDDVDLRHATLRQTSGINGGDTFYTSATKAILRYGQFDAIYFLQQTYDSPYSIVGSPEFIFNSHRVKILKPKDLTLLKKESELIFFSPSESSARLLALRKFLARESSPVVGFLHAATPSWYFPKLLNLLIGGVQPHDAIICPSGASRKAVWNQFSAMSQVFSGPNRVLDEFVQMPLIPIGVDASAFVACSREEARNQLGFTGNDVVILYMGRLNMFGKADLAPLIRAVSDLSHESLGERVTLVLSGADHGNCLEEQVNQYCARFLPEQCYRVICNPDDQLKKKVYASADIFVSLADGIAESFGISLVEAMAAGLPIVCSDWNGYREVVKDGETGLLVDTAWDDQGWLPEALESFGVSAVSTLAASTVVDLQQLKRHLVNLITDDQLRHRLGAQAREFVASTFEWSVVVKRYEALFDELLERGRSSDERFGPRLRHQEVFEHYPTRSFSDGTLLSITSEGKRWLGDPYPLAIHYQDSEPSPKAIETSGFRNFGLIDHQICKALLGLLEGSGIVTWHALKDAAVEVTGCDDWIVRYQIARVLKYGLAAVELIG